MSVSTLLGTPRLETRQETCPSTWFLAESLAVNSEEAAEEALRGISLKMLISQGDSQSWVMSSLTVQGLCLSAVVKGATSKNVKGRRGR